MKRGIYQRNRIIPLFSKDGEGEITKMIGLKVFLINF
jgi:hypothetical protein